MYSCSDWLYQTYTVKNLGDLAPPKAPSNCHFGTQINSTPLIYFSRLAVSAPLPRTPLAPTHLFHTAIVPRGPGKGEVSLCSPAPVILLSWGGTPLNGRIRKGQRGQQHSGSVLSLHITHRKCKSGKNCSPHTNTIGSRCISGSCVTKIERGALH